VRRLPPITEEESSQYSYRSPTGEPTYGEICTCGSGEGEAGNGPEYRWEARKGYTRPLSTPPKGNPWIESLWGRTKAEIGSRIVEASSLPSLRDVFDERFRYYNRERRHSSIGYIPPREHLGQTLDNLESELQIAAAS
jgi:hypothetical protein